MAHQLIELETRLSTNASLTITGLKKVINLQCADIKFTHERTNTEINAI